MKKNKIKKKLRIGQQKLQLHKLSPPTLAKYGSALTDTQGRF
jgi:hypothetical protein